MATSRQAYVSIAWHDEKGGAMYFEGLEKLAEETGTKPEEWDTHEGWVDIDLVKSLPAGAEAILAGRLRLRDRPEDAL